ncbi:hypothetical protein ACF0H5_013622 [Mactra antiquata]
MPRVVQIQSSDSSDAVEDIGKLRYQYLSDSSDNDTDLNKNYNQRMASGVGLNDSLTSYLKFAVNYSLYNVTYNDSDDDPYCLTCIIDGEEKRFKKDARVWLHKSSDRKRKLDCDTLNTETSTNKSSKTEYRELDLLREQIEQIKKLDSENCVKIYRPSNYTDLKSELSSLADSDAELLYSEESSSDTEQVTKDSATTKTVRFDKTLDTSNDYRVQHSISSSSDEHDTHTVGSRSTVSYRSLLSEDEANQENQYSGNFYNLNESRNNFRSRFMASDVSRIAPAISIETESLNESMLDYAVNLQNKRDDVSWSRGNNMWTTFRNDVGHRILQASRTVMMKMKNKSKHGRVQKYTPVRDYNLRSMKKNIGKASTRGNRKSRGSKSSKKLQKEKNLEEIEDNSRVKQYIECCPADSTNNNYSDTAGDNQNRNCTYNVQSLFVLASLKWYAMMKLNATRLK